MPGVHPGGCYLCKGGVCWETSNVGMSLQQEGQADSFSPGVIQMAALRTDSILGGEGEILDENARQGAFGNEGHADPS